MQTAKDAIEYLSKLDPNTKICWTVYTSDEIIEEAKEFGYELTEEQAESVLEIVDDLGDYSIDTIYEIIQNEI